MNVLTKFEAAMRGYRSISAPIDANKAPQIFRSMQASLSNCDSCWISLGNNRFEAARKASEIVEIDADSGDEIKTKRNCRRKIQ